MTAPPDETQPALAEHCQDVIEHDILPPPPAFTEAALPPAANGRLYCGDNRDVMQWLAAGGEQADLIYTDPPFATNQVFRIDDDRVGTVSASGRVAYADKITGEQFLRFLRERLALMRDLMAPHASLYLHCDDKIAYDIKPLMDGVFGAGNFQAAIARIKCNPKNFSRRNFGNVKDTILFYSKSADFVWNGAYAPLSEEELRARFPKTAADGRRYTTTPLHAPGSTQAGATGQRWRGMAPPAGRHWRHAPARLEQLDAAGRIEWSKNGVPRKILYADDARRSGKRMQDVWQFKDPQYPRYPTEKNAAMLDMIIRASSAEGALVMDCFAGSGAALHAAQINRRRWLGIDRSPEAISTIQSRFGE